MITYYTIGAFQNWVYPKQCQIHHVCLPKMPYIVVNPPVSEPWRFESRQVRDLETLEETEETEESEKAA